MRRYALRLWNRHPRSHKPVFGCRSQQTSHYCDAIHVLHTPSRPRFGRFLWTGALRIDKLSVKADCYGQTSAFRCFQYRYQVSFETLKCRQISRAVWPEVSMRRISDSLSWRICCLVQLPVGRPSTTPSDLRRASASFVRRDMRLRSISANSPKAKQRILLFIESSNRYRSFTV